MKATRLFTNSRPDVRARRSRILALVLVALMLSYTPVNGVHAADSSKLAKQRGDNSALNRPDQANQAGVRGAFGKLPLSFEANQGQVDRSVKFFSRGSSYSLFLTSTEAVLSLHKPAAQTPKHQASEKPTVAVSNEKQRDEATALRMKLIGANSNPRVTGLDELPGKSNYFSGRDPKKWQRNVSNYAKVKYSGVYPGVDLLYYGNQQQLEYDFVVSPKANPRSIRLEFKGAARIEIDAQGDLVLHTPLGEIRHRKPEIYQDVNNTRREISGSYVMKGKQQVGFQVGDYDVTRPIVIDPAVVYSTYLGGSGGYDYANGIAVYTDPASGIVYTYVVGTDDESDDFPTKNALQPSHTGSVFVAKFNAAASGEASLIYSTYIQGTSRFGSNQPDIAVDSTGSPYITGNAASTDFPVVNAFQSTFRGPTVCCGGYGGDAFVTKLSPNGSALIYSSFLGGSGLDRGKGITVDSAGNAYVVGDTSSVDFPTVNAFQATGKGAFVAKIAPPVGATPASLVYSTYLGGSAGSSGRAIAVDPAGGIHVTGTTASPDFPTRNALQSTYSFASSPYLYIAFYAKLDPTVSGPASLVYSTYLGSGTAAPAPWMSTDAFGIAVDAAGNAYLSGGTWDSNFPRTFTIGPSLYPGGGYVMKIDPSKSGAASLVYSTIINSADAGSIAVDSAGNAYVTGDAGIGLPLVNGVQQYNNGVLVSVNDGNSWTGFCNGLTSFGVTSLAIDTSTTPRTLYAGFYGYSPWGYPGSGVFKSTDGGANWSAVNAGLANLDVRRLAISPVTPSTIYAATNGGVFRSLNGGSSWNALNDGLSENARSLVNVFAFDTRTNPSALYAATGDGLYKISDGGITWSSIRTGAISGFAIDPQTTPSTLYIADGGYKSTDGGNTWTTMSPMSGGCSGATGLAVDTNTTPSTIYAALGECAVFNSTSVFQKTTDGGHTWQALTEPAYTIASVFYGYNVVVDPTTTPSTIYGIDPSLGIVRSTDGGNSWTFIVNRSIGDLVVDTTSATSTTRSTLYAAGNIEQVDACVMVLDPTGSSLIFSTYLGGIGWDYGSDIALDSSGNIYVTGYTNSLSFPAVNAFQPANATIQSSLAGSGWNAFVVKLGSAALPASSTGSVTTQMAVQTGTLELSFPNITGSTTGTAPTVTVNSLDSTATANYSLSNNLGAYEISTTATYIASPSQPVTLCFQVLTVNDPATFNNLRVMHVENGVPVDVTSSRDFTTRTICASVTSLSPFIIVKGATDQLADLLRLVRSFNLQRGIENSLDAKLQNAQDALTAARSGNRSSACNLMASFISEAQAQSGRALTVAQANQLIAAARQTRAVLGCR